MEETIKKLVAVFNSLGEVTTKGQDTFVMADARRIIAATIDELQNPKKEAKEGEK